MGGQAGLCLPWARVEGWGGRLTHGMAQGSRERISRLILPWLRLGEGERQHRKNRRRGKEKGEEGGGGGGGREGGEGSCTCKNTKEERAWAGGGQKCHPPLAEEIATK